MGREFHVRFREGLGVQFPRATRHAMRYMERIWERYQDTFGQLGAGPVVRTATGRLPHTRAGPLAEALDQR